MMLLLSLVLLAGAQEYSGVPRIVGVGDVHGDFGQFTSVLRAAGVIDEQNRWVAGKTHLVQTGDVVDRGADSRKVLDLLMELEKQAQKAGGRVHALIGNHEAMNIYGDLRYVSAGEFEAFRSDRSEAVRNRYWEHHRPEDGTNKESDAYRRKWEQDHPLGWFEHRIAYAPDGRYGKWIGSHNAIVKVNGVIFLHGGISPKYATAPIADLNKQIRESLRDPSKLGPGGPVMDPDGPLWYRGLAQGSEAELQAHLDDLLAKNNLRRIVIGHTPTASGAVTPRFGGKVLLIDVGLSAAYGSHSACLILEGDKAYQVQNGTRTALP